MSFDCQFKVKDGFCRRLKIDCEPGVKGCILYGRFTIPFNENDDTERDEDDRETDQDKES